LAPVALVVLLAAPLWLRRALPMWDALDFYFPIFGHLADAIRDGRLPLWDPYSNGGEPFFADPQKGLLSPLQLLLALTVHDVYLGFILHWLLHWAWAGLGMVWLARRFATPPLGAALAGCAYALSGFFVSHAQHLPYLYVAAWLPWILGLADDAVTRRRRSSALLAAGALGLCATGGGYPMLVVFTGVATAVWLALRVLAGEHGPADRRVAIAWAAGTLGAMALVLALAWSPVIVAFLGEATAVSNRLGTISTETSIFGSPVNLRSLSSLFFPRATLDMALRGVPFDADLSMINSYVGFATVPLAVTWASTGLRRERKWWLVGFAVFAFMTSLGGLGGIRILLHYLVPPLRYMRFNAPFRIYWLLPLCLAAAGGVRLLLGDEGARRRFLHASIAWGAIGAASGLAVLAWARSAGLPVEPLYPAILAGLATAPLVIAVAALLRRTGAPWGVGLLALITIADVGAAAHLNQASVWAPDRGLLANLDAARDARPPEGGAPPARQYRLMYPFNVHLLLRVPVLVNYTSFLDPDVNDVLYRSRFAGVLCGPRRFWLAPGAEPIASRPDALRALASIGPDEPTPSFVAPADAEHLGPRLIPGSFGSVEVLAYRPESISLRVVNPGATPALLTSVERHTPGWIAHVDGAARQLVRSNLFFRAVWVPPGTHTVALTYRPRLWWPLVTLSSVTLLATFVAAGWLAWRERRRETPKAWTQ
jgi:hypothetical protein